MDETPVVTVCSYEEEGPGHRLYGRSGGVYTYHPTGPGGRLEVADHVETPGAHFLGTHPDGTTLYTAHRIDDGIVVAHRVDRETGELTELSRVASQGRPSYVATDRAGEFVLVANGHHGTVAVLPLDDDGGVEPASDVVQHEGSSVDPYAQSRPCPHCVLTGPDDRFVYVPDRGIDQVVVYELDRDEGTLAPADPPFVEFPGRTGPRHVTFAPDGAFCYVVNELDPSVTAFAVEAGTGRLAELGRWSTLPSDAAPEHSHGADVHLHPSGRWLFASNRGHDSLARFEVDDDTGELAPAGHVSTAHWPRSFAIGPDGDDLYVAARRGDALTGFAVDADSGDLAPADWQVSVPEPRCIDVVG